MIRATASAQTPDATIGELGLALKPGERVVVTGRVACREALALGPEGASTDGVATCTARGKATLLPDRLVVHGPVPYTFPLDVIERVERPRDRIWNGAVTGYVAGFAPFAVMELDCRRRPGCWDGLPLAVGAIVAGPIGFGIGALTDALIHRPRLVYSKIDRRPAVSVSPILAPDGGGVGVAVAF